MGYTSFGKYVRKLMIDSDENLLDLSKVLEVSSAFVSSVFTGKKSVPDAWLEKLTDHYRLSSKEINELVNARDEAKKSVNIDLSRTNIEQRKLAFQFQRKLTNLNNKEIEKLMSILNKGE